MGSDNGNDKDVSIALFNLKDTSSNISFD